jgi:hypothetical protein
MGWKEALEEAGGAPKALTIGGIGAALNFLAFPTPFGYDEWLRIPGFLGALLGYYLGSRSNVSNWPILGAVGVSVGLFLWYMRLVYWGGMPRWYDWVLYPCFIALNVSIFWCFGAIKLGIGGGEGESKQP